MGELAIKLKNGFTPASRSNDLNTDEFNINEFNIDHFNGLNVFHSEDSSMITPRMAFNPLVSSRNILFFLEITQYLF